MYNLYDVCEKLGVSTFTVKNWYRWENKLINEGKITERYLPQPKKLEHAKGSPRVWDEKMLKQLMKYKANMITGRNGIYGIYSNPYHKDTKKYKKQQEENK